MSWVSEFISDPFGVRDLPGALDGVAAGLASSREAAKKEILADKGIDEITKQELIAQIYQNVDVTETMKKAKAGEGIYGNRLKNEQLARTMQDIPGQKQLFLSNQQRVAAGQATLGFGLAQSGPLLTGAQPKGNINPMTSAVIKR